MLLVDRGKSVAQSDQIILVINPVFNDDFRNTDINRYCISTYSLYQNKFPIVGITQSYFQIVEQ